MATTKVLSPGSFPELLRLSRFASFDPTIRQSYGTPPSHRHRGNWGLKRPIAQRKRNAFISLKNFEEHEHYIEWNNAETQVRLIDKIEEINIAPKLVPQVPWFVGLGPAASSLWSRMDTEFAPGESGMPPIRESIPLFTTQLEGLGQRGKGEYGMKPPTKTPTDGGYLHPNVRAMSPKVFKRYIKKLRSLRPQFQKFLRENGVTAPFRETGIPLGNLHVRFLGQHFEKQFQDTRDKDNIKNEHPNQPQSIRQQPHRLAGLMYATPTFLESFFNSGVHPGIVLEDGARTYYNTLSTASSHLVSTAGIVGRLEHKRAGPNVKPAFNNRGLAYPPAALLARQTDANTFINVKVVDLQLERPPVAVTAFPSVNSLKDVYIRMELVSNSETVNNHWRTNTHPPGSMLYNAPEDSQLQIQTKQMYPRPIRDVYNKNGIMDKLREQEHHRRLYTRHYEKFSTSYDNSAALSTLDKIRGSSSENTGLDFTRSNRSKKDKWQDDEWVESPIPNDGGDT